MTRETEAPTRRRLPAALLASGLAVLLPAGYFTACALAPLPLPAVRLEAPATVELAGGSDIELTVTGQTLPSAAGWLDGEAVWSNDDASYPLASLTKLVTALVGLEQEPLSPGEDGAHYSWTADDVALQEELIAQDGVAFPIDEGTDVSHLQMLALALIPSANDFAITYAHSLFGSNAAFVDAVDDWKRRNHLESLVVEEPSGMSPDNRANAADLVRISRLALSDPLLASIMEQASIEVPWGYGTVANSNPLFGISTSVVGLKTGYTEDAGYNLASAETSETGGRHLTGIAVVLGRESDEERTADSLLLLDALASSPREVSILTDDVVIGSVHAVDGSAATLVAEEPLSAVLTPGEHAALASEIHRDGSVTVIATLPTGVSETGTRQLGTLTEPDFWWRLTHPTVLFG